MKKILFGLVAVILMACNQAIEKSSLNIAVDGMSCSHSCAPFIQKKLNGTEGVLEAKVSFENGSAEVVFNTNKVSKDEIVKKIESIANGQYKVGEVEEIKVEKSNIEDSNSSSNDEASIDFDITDAKVSTSTGYQLPNLFSLLNSLLN